MDPSKIDSKTSRFAEIFMASMMFIPLSKNFYDILTIHRIRHSSIIRAAIFFIGLRRISTVEMT